jgi:Flp pilus assembly protein TadD
MDREGRFSVGELSSLTRDSRLTYAQVEARGVPIQNQERLSSLKLRIRATATGEIDRLKEDLVTSHQIIEKSPDKELEIRGFRNEEEGAGEWRLLKLKEDGDRADVVVIQPGLNEVLIKLKLVRRNGSWFLTEVLQADVDLNIISETLQPTIKTILYRRTDKTARAQSSQFVRALVAMQKNAKTAVTIADRALKVDPENQRLRNLKALALFQDEREESTKLWKELAGETRPFAPALLNLARQYERAQDAAEHKLAIEWYARYRELEPDDPRPHVALAQLYDDSDDDVRAETEHLAALKSDPSKTDQFVEFAAFLAIRKRFKEAVSVIDEGDKKASADDDLFGDLMSRLYFSDDNTIQEGLALVQPQRMDKSARANLFLAYVRIDNEGSLRAIPLLRKALALKKDWVEPHEALSGAYRKLRNWTAALNAADAAIKVDAESSEGYFNRACSLARLGRIKEALWSLEKVWF